MIPVDAALGHIFDLLNPLDIEAVPLERAAGRVLAAPVAAMRDQPPFRTSVMDGYAVRSEDVRPGAQLAVIGVAAAGHGTAARVAPGQAVRIFTGAPVPTGADRVVIQEDVAADGDTISIGPNPDPGPYIRAAGADFAAGDRVAAPRRLSPEDLVLLAAMNLADLPCTRRPEVAILTTGDELTMPGGTPGPDQIIASNAIGLAALIEREGGIARRLPIARDTTESLGTAFELARGADLIVTIGGASAGDHDLVRSVASNLGLETAFYRVAMRPGKPLMAGRLGDTPIIGLPGNPASAMVCGHVFILPALRAILGLNKHPARRLFAETSTELAPNGPREHYMRSRLDGGTIAPFPSQDSGLMRVLARADALLIRPANDGPIPAGTPVPYLPL